MLSLSSVFNLPSIFKTKVPRVIDIAPVKTHNVEVEKDKRARSLKHLLKLNHASHSILYHDLEFHNHMPHILGSAYLLESRVDHLEKIYDKEAEQLEKWESSPGEISKHDWRDFLGDRRYQRAFVDFFEDELVHYGYDWRKVVDEYLFQGKAPLVNNMVSGLAHPLIHLGYAMELDSKEIAMEALSLSATCYDFLHKYIDESAYTKASAERTTSPLTILERVSNDTRFDGIFDGPGAGDIEALFKQHEELVLEYWNAWETPEPKKQFQDSQFAAACLLSATAGYNHSYDFFLVHALTSSHAVRIILPFLPPQHHVPVVRQWWLFALAAYITQSRPKIDIKSISEYDPQDRDWTWVDKMAIQGKWSYDAHFVKALRAMKEAAQTWGDGDSFYLKAAVKFAQQFDGWGGFADEEH